MHSIAFYISSHGFGHGARQQNTVRLLSERGHQVHIRTHAPRKFFPTASSYHDAYYDIGMLQTDPLRYDIQPTADWLERFIEQENALIQPELAFIKQHNISLILSDMPPIACEIAQRAGVPCVVMTHFTWDWVYAYYMEREPRFIPMVEHFTAQYAKATLALQMPFAHEFPQFQRVQSVGIFCNPLAKTRDQIRTEFNIPTEHRVAVLSMGGHGWGRTDISALMQVQGWTFLVMPQVYEQVSAYSHVRRVPIEYDGYQHLLAHADLVIGKAGGSTVSEVIAHGTPMIYTLANDWRECALLDEALKTHAACAYLPLANFEQGAWLPLLDSVATLPVPPLRLSPHGTQEAVTIIETL
jgi:UDP:flavonoid glycosyltransferase YjiC (YdhE family)